MNNTLLLQAHTILSKWQYFLLIITVLLFTSLDAFAHKTGRIKDELMAKGEAIRMLGDTGGDDDDDDECDCATQQAWLKTTNLIVLDNLVNVNDVDYNTFVGGDLKNMKQSGNQMNTALFSSYSKRSLEVVGKVNNGNDINIFYSGAFSNSNAIVKQNANQYTINGRRFNANSANQGATLAIDNTLSSTLSDVKNAVKDLSESLADRTANNTLSFGNNGTEARLNVNNKDTDGIAVFKVSDTQLFENSAISQIIINNNVNASTIIINVSGQTVNWQTANMIGSWLTSTDGRSKTLWNFYEATSIVFSRNLMGALLAPKATLQTSVDINGSVAVKSLNSSASIRQPYFAGNLCSSLANVVTLNVKVFLQGAALLAKPGTMRNSLQTFATDNPGEPHILPTIDPYTGTATYKDINSTSGPVGALVDWVQIQIRSIDDPNTILESKSLLLQTDGTVVDVTGGVPVFKSQAQPVYLVVLHRNHLTILSKAITAFSGAVSYDFTSAENQAYQFNPSDDTPQQVLVDGKWCMWAGDAFCDGALDANDISVVNLGVVNATFSQYLAIDTYMDGVLDANDFGVTNLNVNNAMFSSLVGAGYQHP